MKPTKNKSDFKHFYDVVVTFDKVDMLHIVNNAVYLVRNEINYLKAALFEDRLRVYTRISYIKNSSFGFEHMIENLDTGIIIAEGLGVLVHVDPIKKKSIPLPEEFYQKILEFESKVEILKSV